MFLKLVFLQVVLSVYADGDVKEVFVKSGANGGEGTEDSPVGKISDALTKLTDDTSPSSYIITVLKPVDSNSALVAGENVFEKDKPLMLRGKQSDNAIPDLLEINCSSAEGNGDTSKDIFICKNDVSFKHLKFIYPMSLGTASNDDNTLAIIRSVANSGENSNDQPTLTISTCHFERPETGVASIHLVKVEAGEFNMEAVSCKDETNIAKFSATPFLIEGAAKVTLIASTLNNIESSASSVVKIVGKENEAITVNVHGCTFSNCKSTENANNATSGALYVESNGTGSKFNISESSRISNATTTFKSCECANGKSGGIYLKMPNISNESQLSWPKIGTNLIFTNCTAGSKSTGLYLDVNSGNLQAIAKAMKKSFAENYVKGTNDWFVAAKGANESAIDIDFTTLYFDPHEAYVQSGGNDDTADGTKTKPFKTIKKAYELFADSKGSGEFSIKIMKNESGQAVTGEAITFSKETGITIEGVVEAEDAENEAETKVEINCTSTEGTDLFTCKEMVTFKNLVFDFSTTSGQITDGYEANEDLFALIHAVDGSVSLTIENCEFKRPTSGEVKFHLVKVSAGSLTMSTVDCTEESKTNADAITFSATPFLVEGTSDVTLISLNLKKITSKESAVVKVKSANKVVIKLDKCTFTECISTVDTTSGALYVESENVESTFTIGNTGETKFENCTCAKGKAGAIYLKMIGITEATQLSWPETGTNLKFTSCAAGEGDSKKNTALYLNVPVTLHEEIAAAMKASFATDYKRGTNDWFVAANSEDGDVDFTSNYFDLPIVYVKKDGNDENGNTYENPMGNLSKAYELFEEIKSASGFTIKIIKETDAKNVLTADAVEFNKETGVRIVGVTKANEEETETEVTLDCKVEIGKDLFTCKKKVEFRGITFKFPLSLDAPKESNTGASSLIVAETDSVSLTINKCKFVRPESVAHSNDEEIAKIHLVNVKAGELEMSGVECKGDNEVKFQESLFVISESSSVKFDTVEINKVSMTDGAVISIRDATDKASTVKIEGLTMNEVKSANGLSAGIMIKMADNGSKVEMGREKKCSFKSCEAEKGDSGAIFIEMKEIVSNLKLPGEGKLEFDNNNKGKDSSVASLCIIAPDFDEYSKQEDAFGFAKDYNDDNKGWIVGAKKEGDNLEDVYEKYLKHKEPKDEPEPEKKKSNAGTVVAIVVPIVVVVIVVVVVIIAIIVVRKKRSRNN